MKAWVKLHRRISAKLQKCHPYTRGIAWEILRHADDEGRIPLEGEAPIVCLTRLLGGDRRMRNALPGDLAELERIGMLSVVGDDLRFASFGKHQERPQSGVSATSVEPQSDVSPTSVVPQSSVGRASVEPQHEAKSMQSLNSAVRAIREEEKREEGEESPVPGSGPDGPSLTLLPFEPKPPKPDPVVEVFDHWRSVMGHPRSRLDGKRRKRIAAALKNGYSQTDLEAAIDGCRASPFHMGANDAGTRYDGIDVVFRDADQIDKFIALSPRTLAVGRAASLAAPVDKAAAREALVAKIAAQSAGGAA